MKSGPKKCTKTPARPAFSTGNRSRDAQHITKSEWKVIHAAVEEKVRDLLSAWLLWSDIETTAGPKGK